MRDRWSGGILMKLLEALDKAGIELISANATGGRGVRLKKVQKKPLVGTSG
jgi:hypothetical protein